MIIQAGPCGWENETQARQVIKFLCGDMGIKWIRGGFKKYRSDPDTFQGVGIFDAIEMLEELKKEYGFKLVVEVFNSDDVALLETFADMYQIGSRNAYNTDLLKATNKFNKPVLYKRHYSMGLNEMVMHSKYMTNKVILCLRGDLSIHPQEQRFKPDFADIQRLRELSDNQICYDVSHSSCHRRYIEKNVLAAMVYEPEYMQIECHPNPRKALSDPKQQLNFSQFEKLYKKIKEMEAVVA